MDDEVAVEGAVVGTNRGGIIVEVESIRGFCPGSQLGQRVATFEELLDRKMLFKVGGGRVQGAQVQERALGCAAVGGWAGISLSWCSCVSSHPRAACMRAACAALAAGQPRSMHGPHRRCWAGCLQRLPTLPLYRCLKRCHHRCCFLPPGDRGG